MGSSEKKKLKISKYDCHRIKDAALFNYKSLAPSNRMDADSFLVFCWMKAVVDFLDKEDYTSIDVTKDSYEG